ncbi:polysaccharide deacetylase family protein [Alkaliphilus pronyensis]|nr:polysaccharide deacetylase family protein [Alkaliphilus pronyensis]
MKRIAFIALALITVILFTAACQSNVDNNSDQPVVIEDNQQKGDEVKNQEEETQEEIEKETQEEIEEETEENTVKEIDLEVVKPNEAGEVMVLMYHHIKEPEAEWSRTPDNFRRDLKELYDRGFRPISLYDYATGNITTEAGMTPLVITFDDGNQNNFNMIEDENGEWIIDPDCAVGILVAFNERYPDFPLEATFYINGGVPFGQKEFVEYKLNYIVDKGMDIGNHTITHVNFTNTTPQIIQEEIGKLSKFIKEYLPNYEVNTLALPFGSKPSNKEWHKYLAEGEYEGENYENVAILEVGWDPYHSPFSNNFNPLKIRRVRGSETKVDGVGLYDWLKAFDEGKRLRYISDGDPNYISVPEEYKNSVSDSKKQQLIRTY